jgi:chemotaxis protein MotB
MPVNLRKLILAPSIVVATMAVAGCVSQSSYDAVVAQNQQLQQQVSQLLGAIKYTADSDLLFASGSWQMTPRGQEIIARFAEKLAPTQQHLLIVDGYTDNAPIGPALRARGVTSNDVLSQYRADAVREFLVAHGGRADWIIARGHGEANPVESNDTPEGRHANRRVELSLDGPAS